MEFLLIIVKMFLIENSPDTKIILMSATFDTEEFAEYFKIQRLKPVTIELVVKRQFRISEFYLDDLGSLANKVKIDYDNPSIDGTIYNIAVVLITMLSGWEEDQVYPTILVFLPGINEIQEMYRRLTIQAER